MSGQFTRKGFLATLVSFPVLLIPGKCAGAMDRGHPARPASIEARRSLAYLLNRFFVAGLRHYDGVALVAAGGVKVGDALRLVAEPSNEHDEYAVEIFHEATGVKLGYVPRRENKHLSWLLRQGARLEAHPVAVFPEEEPWEAVEVEVRIHCPAGMGGRERVQG